jgi:hypothetical protein
MEPTGLWVTIPSDEGSKDACIGCQKCVPLRSDLKIFIKTADSGAYSLHQNVTVKRTTPHEGWAACFIFGVPLLFAFAALLVWNYISSQTVGSPLSIGVMGAAVLIGFIAVFKGDAFFRSRFPARLCIVAAPHNPLHTHG